MFMTNLDSIFKSRDITLPTKIRLVKAMVWTWLWVNSGSWWCTGRPGVLRFMGSQRVGHDWVTELNWNEWLKKIVIYQFVFLEAGEGVQPGCTLYRDFGENAFIASCSFWWLLVSSLCLCSHIVFSFVCLLKEHLSLHSGIKKIIQKEHLISRSLT